MKTVVHELKVKMTIVCEIPDELEELNLEMYKDADYLKDRWDVDDLHILSSKAFVLDEKEKKGKKNA